MSTLAQQVDALADAVGAKVAELKAAIDGKSALALKAGLTPSVVVYTPPASPARPAIAVTVSAESYTTRPGDMLDLLALRFYGRHAVALELLLAANAAQYEAITAPVLAPGLSLIIPDKAALAAPDAVAFQPLWD